MALIERDVVLMGRLADGTPTIDLPITRLGNVEDTAEVKNTADEDDYIPVIDMADKGQMKKVTMRTLTDAIAEIGGIPDTSDATAAAEDILTGKSAYVQGVKVEGTMPVQEAQTITPGTESQSIAGGRYLTGEQTIEGDANLTAGNIKSGTSIFGVAGSFTSDATAEAGEILSGKSAYVNGVKVDGTMAAVEQAAPSISVEENGLITASAMQNAGCVAAGTKSATQQLDVQGAQIITPGTSDQQIAKGKYLTGEQTIKGDASLLAANIKSGVRIFGVDGSFTADATAAAGDILTGKSAYVKGVKIDGTMQAVAQAAPAISVSSSGLITASAAQNAGCVAAGTKSATYQLTTQGAQTITPGRSSRSISSGRYLTGAQTIQGDSNLLAANIKKGVSIFGVSGSCPTGLYLDYDQNRSDYLNTLSIPSSGIITLNGEWNYISGYLEFDGYDDELYKGMFFCWDGEGKVVRSNWSIIKYIEYSISGGQTRVDLSPFYEPQVRILFLARLAAVRI